MTKLLWLFSITLASNYLISSACTCMSHLLIIIFLPWCLKSKVDDTRAPSYSVMYVRCGGCIEIGTVRRYYRISIATVKPLFFWGGGGGGILGAHNVNCPQFQHKIGQISCPWPVEGCMCLYLGCCSNL